MNNQSLKNKLPLTTLTKLQYCQRLLWAAQKIESYAMTARHSYRIELRGTQTIDDMVTMAIYPKDRLEYFGLSSRSYSIFSPLVEAGMFSYFDYKHCPKFWNTTGSIVQPTLVHRKLRELELTLRNTPDSELFNLVLFPGE